jgi:signal transduction histidine kinase/CheY-like chemotaxis protein
MSRATLLRVREEFLDRKWITWGLALLLVAISVGLAWQREQTQIANQSREVSVQARILGGSAAGALAFDDAQTVREYVNALQRDQSILAAGIYGTDGRLVAGFSKDDTQVPSQADARAPSIDGRQLTVIETVEEGGIELGTVYLRTSVEPLVERLSRYAAIGIVVLMAALLIAVLGASNAAAKAANRQLQEEIVARERAEQALRQAQKMEALGQLIGGVAHDFNNLLMAASSGLELMDRAKEQERRERLKEGVRDALEHGARLTQHLLAFARRTPLQTEVVQISTRIDKLAHLLDRALREDISVKFDIADDLWPIEVDLSQFDIALLNVALNARDAMPNGGQVCITAENRPGGLDGADAVQVTIEDQGEGMTAEAVEKAFEPFFTTKDVGQGTGLGLSQVYGFCHAAGGSVSIASVPGVGTRVAMLFPRSRLPDPVAANGAERHAPDALRGLRVLLVEDDPALNDLVCQMLQELGSQVTKASSGASALLAATGEDVDLVLSDMVMPGDMDGLELARRLRERDAEMPVVLMTGYSAAAGLAADEGFTVLHKPFDFDRLTVRISEAMSGVTEAGATGPGEGPAAP